MNDKRFEAWWTSNPARVALNPAAKEVARKVWKAAQQDLIAEQHDACSNRIIRIATKETVDQMLKSRPGRLDLQRGPWESVTAFEDRYVRARDSEAPLPLDRTPFASRNFLQWLDESGLVQRAPLVPPADKGTPC